jgi:hypothetical protein
MPWCKCHSFESLEARALPRVSHDEIAGLIGLSALETITNRTDEEMKKAHDRMMKLQEDFLRKIGDRLQRYEATIRADCLRLQREWNKYDKQSPRIELANCVCGLWCAQRQL